MRERSTTAPQSLTLLNSNEVTAAAKMTAGRLQYESASTQQQQQQQQQIESAYRLILGRMPTSKERIMIENFLINSPFDEFCRALFNLNEFVYVE